MEKTGKDIFVKKYLLVISLHESLAENIKTLRRSFDRTKQLITDINDDIAKLRRESPLTDLTEHKLHVESLEKSLVETKNTVEIFEAKLDKSKTEYDEAKKLLKKIMKMNNRKKNRKLMKERK